MVTEALNRRVVRVPDVSGKPIEKAKILLEDAGLTRKDIDGLATYPGGLGAGAPGFTGAGLADVHDALRLNLNWFTGGLELPGQLGKCGHSP